MSSAGGSRDLKSSGVEPKIIPLGYSARVLYTFLPHEKENTEIFVSEGDIVELQYRVGGWVYVRTEDGETGYIPANFCSRLPASVPKTSLISPQKSVRFNLPEDKFKNDENVRSHWGEVCITQTSFSSKSYAADTRNNFRIKKFIGTGRRDLYNGSRNTSQLQPLKALHITQLACKVPEETYGSGRKKQEQTTKQVSSESLQGTGVKETAKENNSEGRQTAKENNFEGRQTAKEYNSEGRQSIGVRQITKENSENKHNSGSIQIGRESNSESKQNSEASSLANNYKQQTCEICNSILSRFAWKVQSLAVSDLGKADLEPRNLLKEPGSASKEGLQISFNPQAVNDRDTLNSTRLNEIGSVSTSLQESILKTLSESCVQCAVVRNYLNSKGTNSMSALYSNIRDLHLHAVSDSESESESDSDSTESQGHKELSSGNTNGISQICCDSIHTGEDLMKEISDDIPNQEKIVCNGLNKEMKRSASVSLPRATDNSKQSALRNNSFSVGSNSSVIYEGRVAWNEGKDVNTISSCVQNQNIPPSYHEVFNTGGECNKNSVDVNSDSDQDAKETKASNGFIESGSLTDSNDESTPMDFKDFPTSAAKVKTDGCQNQTTNDNEDSHSSALSSCQNSPLEEQKCLSLNVTNTVDGSDDGNVSSHPAFTDTDDKSRNTFSNGCILRQPKQSESYTKSVQNSTNCVEKLTNGDHMCINPPDSSHSRKMTSFNGTLSKNNALAPPGSRNRFQTLPNKVSLLNRLRPQNAISCNGSLRGPSQDGHSAQPPRILSLPPPAGPISVSRRMLVSHTDAKHGKHRLTNDNDLSMSGLYKQRVALDTKPDKQEEMEIRKTLQEHSVSSISSRRTGQSPMRAHHSINAGLFKDSQTPIKHTGRTILVKKFNKQMWRAPNGAPEGGESQRPFSPFGGTLPPSKIMKKKVVEVFV